MIAVAACRPPSGASCAQAGRVCYAMNLMCCALFMATCTTGWKVSHQDGTSYKKRPYVAEAFSVMLHDGTTRLLWSYVEHHGEKSGDLVDLTFRKLAEAADLLQSVLAPAIRCVLLQGRPRLSVPSISKRADAT